MRLLPFLVYTAIGSTIWNTALIGAGAILGNQWERVEPYMETFQWVVIAAIFVFVVRFAVVKIRSRA
jgi:membrane protein DedA with SNARE-associated domain